MLILSEASFVKSASKIEEALPSDSSEVVFLGRSNVGKSSLLNSLANRKNLAKKSSTPGKTQLINFFDITYKNSTDKFKLRFVDMPGFGYARVSKSIKEEWTRSLTEFLEKRNSIRVFIQLIDSRHFGLDIDINVNEYLNSLKKGDQNILLVVTKSDKLNQSSLQKLKNNIKKDNSFKYSNILFVSNLKKSGIDKVNRAIFELIFGVLDEG